MPFSLTNEASTIWRDFNTDGVPASEKYSPRKTQIRTWGTEIQNYLRGVTPLDQVNITGGNIGGATTFTGLATPIPLASGGTGAQTKEAALVSLGLNATAAEINLLEGATAPAAKLNILTGATITTAELNALTGVTALGTTLIRIANASAGRDALGVPDFFVSTGGPSGGADGDIWLQY